MNWNFNIVLINPVSLICNMSISSFYSYVFPISIWLHVFQSQYCSSCSLHVLPTPTFLAYPFQQTTSRYAFNRMRLCSCVRVLGNSCDWLQCSRQPGEVFDVEPPTPAAKSSEPLLCLTHYKSIINLLSGRLKEAVGSSHEGYFLPLSMRSHLTFRLP